jgi:hypothetical protein
LFAFVAYRVLLLSSLYFAWYLVPFTGVVALCAAAGLQWMERRWALGARVAAVALSILFALPVPFTFPLERRIQTELETGLRKRVGEYLATVVRKDEAVVCESLGYFGWYSGATIYDYPGLASPKALDALLKHPLPQRSLAQLIRELKTEWVVVRPSEFQELASSYPETAALYQVNRRFSAGASPFNLSFAGLSVRSIDNDFIVYRRAF